MKNKQYGFTLVEVIISLAILSVVSIYLIQMLIATKNMSTKSFEIDQSVRISRNIIELLSSGEKISPNSKNELISNMKLENNIYTLNLNDKFKIDKTEKSSYKLNLILKQEDGLNNINIRIIRLKPYIMNQQKNLEISNINSIKIIK